MIVNVVIPTIGESVTEAEIARWLVEDGMKVEKDEEIAEIDSEKATITLSAENSGIIKILTPEGETVKIGAVIGEIDTDASGDHVKEISTKEDETPEDKNVSENIKTSDKNIDTVKLTPLAKQIIESENIKAGDLTSLSNNKKITKSDVLAYLSVHKNRKTNTVKMSMLRRKLSERLVAVKNQTAMLTTFNEVNMEEIISLRKQYKDAFIDKHKVKLGFMSFFVKAVTIAIKDYPEINAYIDGDYILYHDYVDVSIAVSTEKGLMVPVIRNAELMSMADIEIALNRLSEKARDNEISIDEMKGGTFTITNGGVFGSLLSTPIINPPQSAILGMHNIQERAVVINGAIQIKPMMYIALSYDHRIIDGKESVGFIVKLKELLENPLEITKGIIL